MIRALVRCGPLLALLLGLTTLGAAKQKTPEMKSWVLGPIRYVAQPDEIKTFKALKNDGDRALFIERFWARRDPTPETLANEYRQLFWERVNEANSMFLDSHKPGWKTDRGKIHILYGPPTSTEEDLHLATEGLPAAGRGLIRWIYEGRPGGRIELDPIVVVPFVRDASGEYRISYDPKLSSVFFDALAIEENRYRAVERFEELLGAPRRSTLSVMLDLGRMQEVPPQAQVLLERVETTESYQTRPITVRLSRYLHPGRQAPLAVVTVDVGHVNRDHPPSVIARFSPRDPTREIRMLGEDSFQLVERDDLRLAQGRLLLDPGTYDLTVLVADSTTAVTGIHRASFTATPPSPVLRFSDVLLASELQSLDYVGLASHDEAYLVGPFRVVPKLDRSYRPGETVKLFFEVYGGTPPYRVAYRLEGRERDGSWIALGQPSAAEQERAAQAWELPTSDRWPLGEYQIRIEVTDREDRLISTPVPFTVEAGGSP